MDKTEVVSFIVKAAQNPSAGNLNNLYNAVNQYQGDIKDFSEKLNELFELINSENMDAPTANFVIAIGAFNIENSPLTKSLVANAIKTLLPPFLNHNPIIRALGVRDDNVPPSNIVGRFRKLTALKNGQILFLNNSGRWGTVSGLDSMTGTVAINQFGVNAATNNGVPLELVLVSGILFNSGIEIIKIADASNRYKLSANEFKTIAKNKSILPLTDAHLEQLAKFGCAKSMAPEEFEKWWNSTSSSSATAKRRSCDGRTIQEITILLASEDASQQFSDEEAKAFGTFFTNLKREVIIRNLKALAEVIVKISDRATSEQLEVMLSPLMDKTPFWPADPIRAAHDSLSVWSELSAKDIAKLADITLKAFHEDYIAGLSNRLPLKALNALTPLASFDELDALLTEQHSCSNDLTLWIWKNRKKAGKALIHHVNIYNIIRSLSQDNLPKAWTASRRELHNLLMDNAEFQEYLINDAGAMKLTAALQGALFLSSGERQSLVVKLARVSKELQAHLESGAGQKILQAGMSEKEQKAAAAANNNEPTYTSTMSHRKLMQELDDIIKIHRPENREALKTARAHGDFRENSEFDAAKERRNFLTRRQNELERELMFIQPINMRDVEVANVAVIGSKVTLENSDGTQEVHYLLGAWDGDPDKNYLSYKTRLGQAIYNREKGDKIEKPNGSTAVIVKVEVPEEAVLKDMD